MKAIVRKAYGGPEQLELREVPTPMPAQGEILIHIRAFGINRAEQYFRQGLWGEVAAISGIECVGEVAQAPGGQLQAGQRVIALMGGMGRTRNGSYAEYVVVPAANVVPIETALDWPRLAALPESYATAWSCLHDNLEIASGEVVVIRGATSALGMAACNLARHAGAHVIATVRSLGRADLARAHGANDVIVEDDTLAESMKERYPVGVDAVLDLVGTRTVLDSLRMAKRRGRVCVAGFLGHAGPIAQFDPIAHLPSGRHLSFFGSAFVYGTPDYPLSDIPFQQIIALAESGVLNAEPARIFDLADVIEAHRHLDAETAGGKMVVVT